jgi:hypothetical protein
MRGLTACQAIVEQIAYRRNVSVIRDDGERLKACWDRLYRVVLLAAEFRGGEQHDRQTR